MRSFAERLERLERRLRIVRTHLMVVTSADDIPEAVVGDESHMLIVTGVPQAAQFLEEDEPRNQ